MAHRKRISSALDPGLTTICRERPICEVFQGLGAGGAKNGRQSRMARVMGEIEDHLRSLLQGSGIQELNKMQVEALQTIRTGAAVLIVAPTGSGKTEAALFPILESLGASEGGGIRALYITPLRALNRNLIDRFQRLVASTSLTAAVRHGDTPTSDRRKQAANPPDILITTPETLQAILSGKLMQRHLKAVRYVVVDEVHQFA